MGWWLRLVDLTRPPICSYGADPAAFIPEYRGDEPCPKPCYPCVQVRLHIEGGTYTMGGTNDAEMSVTYNYGKHFREAWPEPLDGPGALDMMLNGRRAGEVVPLLAHAIMQLGTTRSDNYWDATPGNAGHALKVFLDWALDWPNAVFSVD